MPGRLLTFTVQPKIGLSPAVGAPSENNSVTITVSGGNISEAKSFTASFTVKNWGRAPSIALTPGHYQLAYTIEDSDPVADSYDVYYVMGNKTVVAEVKAPDLRIAGASITGTKTELSAHTTYSFIVCAHKTKVLSHDKASTQNVRPIRAF
jgi:hypothetical protein